MKLSKVGYLLCVFWLNFTYNNVAGNDNNFIINLHHLIKRQKIFIMKNLALISIFLIAMFQVPLEAQQSKDSKYLSYKTLTGTWQRDNKIVGNGLDQNFVFLENGSFILNLGDDSEDLRTITQLKGKYRIEKNKLFFTILSQTIVEGQIGLADGGISLSLLELKNTKAKEITESNPKEIADPCYISVLSKTKIKLSNEIYYKIQ